MSVKIKQDSKDLCFRASVSFSNSAAKGQYTPLCCNNTFIYNGKEYAPVYYLDGLKAVYRLRPCGRLAKVKSIPPELQHALESHSANL